MFLNRLENYNVLLASNSKRRHKLLSQLKINFSLINQKTDESFSKKLKKDQITDYLAKKKSSFFLKKLKKNDILITSDTIVWHKNKALGKPKSKQEAFNMIKSLENDYHHVISSICISTLKIQVVVNEKTKVYFDKINDDDLLYYVNSSDVTDRAGGYGIQDFIGSVFISKIEGSYNNVLGFPTNKFIKTINSMDL